VIGQAASGQIQKQTWAEIPLDLSGANLPAGPGFSDRGYDHATLAMNNNKDVVVAFHSSRGYRSDDLANANLEWAGDMKQVEIAFFEYTGVGGIDSWTHFETRIIGSVDWDPVANTTQNTVKCERPDVVVVGDQFFVVWTRRYHNSYPGQSIQPAVLECAFVEFQEVPSKELIVRADPTFPGLGIILDKHESASFFGVRECSGVADAVALGNGDPDLLEAAVVYPHVLSYSNTITGDRTFELRVVTCSLRKSNGAITINNFPALASSVPFNGAPSPSGVPSTGLILPDLGPSDEEMAFWLLYERQKLKPVTGSPDEVPDGRVKLEYRKLDASTNEWNVEASKTFKGFIDDWSWRRRPTISSVSKDSQKHYAAISFSTVSSVAPLGTASPGVHFEIWEYDAGTLSSSSPAIPLYVPWPNFYVKWDDKPHPLLGRVSPILEARFFATREAFPPSGSVPMSLMSFDPAPATSVMKTLDADVNGFNGIRRPAAAYLYDPSATNPHYYAVTWEKIDYVPATPQKKVYLYFE
jgi:hypothetical protein